MLSAIPSAVIPERAQREPGIHASRIVGFSDVQLHIKVRAMRVPE